MNIKIDNLFSSIVNSQSYNMIKNDNKYNNYLEPQKEVFKTLAMTKR